MRILKRVIIGLSVLAIGAFPLLIIYAASMYKGGTVLDSGVPAFSILDNQIGDLGRTKGFNNILNIEVKSWFILAFQLLAAGIAVLQFTWFTTFKRHRARLWSGAAFIFSVLAAIHLWGVVLFPADENFPRHSLFMMRAIGSLSIMAVAGGFAYYFEPPYKHRVAIIWWFAGFISLVTWLMMVYGPAPWSSHNTLHVQYILQKCMWVTMISTIVYHGWITYGKVRQEQ